MRRRLVHSAFLLMAGAIACTTAGCGSTSGSAPAVPQASAPEVTVTDPWVRATVGIPDPTMTTVFGEFTNHTAKNLTIVSAANSLTSRTELHRMTMTGDVMVMGVAVGGIPVPAHTTTGLDPNSSHIMITDLKSTIQPGDTVQVTATLNDGAKITFQALAKEYAGGNESYASSTAGAMPGMAPGSTGAMSGHG